MTEKKTIKIDFFWIAVAVMVVAMMHYGYSCDCNRGACISPAGENVLK